MNPAKTQNLELLSPLQFQVGFLDYCSFAASIKFLGVLDSFSLSIELPLSFVLIDKF